MIKCELVLLGLLLSYTYKSNMSHYHQLTKEQPESVTKLNLPGNTSVVLLKKQTIEVRDEPLPILQPDGVLVKVISTDKSFTLLRIKIDDSKYLWK